MVVGMKEPTLAFNCSLIYTLYIKGYKKSCFLESMYLQTFSDLKVSDFCVWSARIFKDDMTISADF